MIDFLQDKNGSLTRRVGELELLTSDMKQYLNYLAEEMEKLYVVMEDISSDEYLEFKKIKGREKRIDKLLKD